MAQYLTPFGQMCVGALIATLAFVGRTPSAGRTQGQADKGEWISDTSSRWLTKDHPDTGVYSVHTSEEVALLKITLPDAKAWKAHCKREGVDDVLHVMATDAGPVKVSPRTGQTIDGRSTTVTIHPRGEVDFAIYDGGWRSISENYSQYLQSH